METQVLTRGANKVLVGRWTVALLGADPDALAYMPDDEWDAIAIEKGLPIIDERTKYEIVANFRKVRTVEQPEVVIRALPEDPILF